MNGVYYLGPGLMLFYGGKKGYITEPLSLHESLMIKGIKGSENKDLDKYFVSALLFDYLNAIKLIISKGYDIQTTKKNIFYEAIKNNSLETFKYFVSLGMKIKHIKDDLIETASAYGALGIVKYLIKLLGNITNRNNISMELAASKGHFQIVKYLEEKGAFISADSDSNKILEIKDQAILSACTMGYFKMVRFLVLKGAWISNTEDKCVLNSASDINLDIIKYLYYFGANSVSKNYEYYEYEDVSGEVYDFFELEKEERDPLILKFMRVLYTKDFIKRN